MEEALAQSETSFATGQIVKGTIIEIRSKEVMVDIGYKSEGSVPASEFEDLDEEDPGPDSPGLVGAPRGSVDSAEAMGEIQEPQEENLSHRLCNIYLCTMSHTR